MLANVIFNHLERETIFHVKVEVSNYTIDIEQSSFMLANVIFDHLEREPGLYNILILFFIMFCGEV